MSENPWQPPSADEPEPLSENWRVFGIVLAVAAAVTGLIVLFAEFRHSRDLASALFNPWMLLLAVYAVLAACARRASMLILLAVLGVPCFALMLIWMFIATLLGASR